MTSTATRRRIEGIRTRAEKPSLADSLRATSNEALLTSFAALTHRIHECQGNQVAGQCDGPCTAQRKQRDAVQAEVLRRMNGQ